MMHWSLLMIRRRRSRLTRRAFSLTKMHVGYELATWVIKVLVDEEPSLYRRSKRHQFLCPNTHTVTEQSPDAGAYQWVKNSEVSQGDAQRGDQGMLVRCNACQTTFRIEMKPFSLLAAWEATLAFQRRD